jgi:sulfhydrogenase subunit gamma (sulfur reductase)
VKNPYLPQLATIQKVKPETYDTTTFTLRLDEPEAAQSFEHRPGQFMEVSVFGAGEAPFCIASSAHGRDTLDITVRKVGRATNVLHELGEGAQVGIRGPLGNSFPLDEFEGKHILVVGGGLGLAPLRPQIHDVYRERARFASVTVLYGARTQEDLIYRDELDQWQQADGMECLLTVDRATDGWEGNVGVVGTLFEKIQVDAPNTVVFVCGPPIMITFVVRDLVSMGFGEDAIISTLERHMRCGIGKCNHCMMGDKYICEDGPVFTYRQMKAMTEFEA